MKLGTFKHTAQEKKRYTVSFSEWLEVGEVITTAEFAITPTTSPVLLIEGGAVDGNGLGITFYVSGGLDENEYRINTLITTDSGQRKEDYMIILVEDYDA